MYPGFVRAFIAWIALSICGVSSAIAASQVDTVRVDLNPLIDGAAHTRSQFAINVRHPVSIWRHGIWTAHGKTRTWVYSTRVPTAISMSFHAPSAVLPPSAVLTVSNAHGSFKYTAHQVSRGGIWSRPLAGDTLTLSLTVSSAEANQVRLQIDSLQAGYRSIGPGTSNHPRYQALIKAASATQCTENFECHVSDANQGPSHATVVVLVANLYQCTGILLNNTSGDSTPYVLTARHCETGELGGGNPAAASSAQVIWDAITPCGTTLGTIYTAGAPSQNGATTVLEQQDAWLMQLDTLPVSSDAFYAGWDSSGNPITGGYTIHNALNGTQQYVGWSGTDILEQLPAATLGIGYDSTFWGVVNGVGSIGAGASGSALFSPDNRVVGLASLAALIDGADSGGVCPVATPPAPSAQTATALFTALSGVWKSTADRTSSTARTLQSFLDPSSTGQQQIDGVGTSPLTLTASATDANTGTTVTLSWNVSGAQSCNALGGASGDGWTGSVAASGSMQVGNSTGGTVTYSLACHLTSGLLGSGSAVVNWDYDPPAVVMTGPSVPLMVGGKFNIDWSSDVDPCTGSGGVSGDGWAGPEPDIGDFSVTLNSTTPATYTITCGSAGYNGSSSTKVFSIEPAIVLAATTSTITTGSLFGIQAFESGVGGNCTPSGGSSTDFWANTGTTGLNTIVESTAGTYTYTMTCTGGGQSPSSSVTVVVTDDAPAVSLTAVYAQQQVIPAGSQAGAPYDLLWTSNQSDCSINWTANGSTIAGAYVPTIGATSGAVSDSETQPGPVTYTIACGAATATATINWVSTATPVPNALALNTSNWAAGVPQTISWNAAAGPCTASGGGTGDGWSGAKAQSGSQSLTETQPGAYLFTLACGSAGATATGQVAALVPFPTINLNAQGAGMIWQSTVGPCTYMDGTTGSSRSVPPNGSSAETATTSGMYLFTLTCGSGANTFITGSVAQIDALTPATLSASAQTVAVFSPVTLTWSADANDYCLTSGGAGAPWTGPLPSSAGGSLIVTSSAPGTVTYAFSCDNGTSAQTQVTYTALAGGDASAPAAVNLTASASSIAPGQSVSLSWSSKNAGSCSASGGESGDGWAGASLAPSGSKSVSESSAGTVSYSITCAGGPPAATAMTTVTVTAAASGGGSHGGGGSLDLACLVLLALSLVARAGRRAREERN